VRFITGESRAVLVLPTAGIVVKFPIIHFVEALKALTSDVWKYGWELGYRGFRNSLINGLASNWIEFLLYVKTGSPFLQPTYFSLFGLLNIQRYGNPCSLRAVDLWCQLCALTENKVWDDGHHFSNPKNFTLDGGSLRMLDYGSSRTFRVVNDYGRKIAKTFDPSYNWDEVQNKFKD